MNTTITQPLPSRAQSRRLSEFAKRLKELRLESGKSYYRLEQDTGITAAYIWRLEHGERSRPSPDMLVLLSLGLLLDRQELINLVEMANTLLESAGYAPLVRLPRLSDEELNPPPTRAPLAGNANMADANIPNRHVHDAMRIK